MPMNDPDPSISQLSAKINDVILGIKWMFSLVILFSSIPNFCTSLPIGIFAELFRYSLPGKPLPLLTLAVIHYSTFLLILTLVWPVIGILNIFYSRRASVWMVSSSVIICLIGLQIFFTWVACFLPFLPIVNGMSDTMVK